MVTHLTENCVLSNKTLEVMHYLGTAQANSLGGQGQHAVKLNGRDL